MTIEEENKRLREWLQMIWHNGPADDMDPNSDYAEAAIKGWSVDDLLNGRIPFNDSYELPEKGDE